MKSSAVQDFILEFARNSPRYDSPMATLDDVRSIARELPGSIEGEGRFGFSVIVKGKAKGFIWSWNERIHPKKPKVPNDSVLAVRVPNLQAKEMILQSDSTVFFTEDHYIGYPAVLVRIEAISAEDLRPLIIEAWKTMAPPKVVKEFLNSAPADQ